MKKIIFSIIVFAVAFSGCAKFTDIMPKGKNLLSSVGDLNLLLNTPFNNFSVCRTTNLTSSIYYTDINNTFNVPTKTFAYALLFWDESVDRVGLRENCNIYEPIYAVIGQTCNPVISRIDAASGSQIFKDRYKAEALVLRAWFHYLSVNLFAKAYDPATAATDGGVPYSLDTDLMSIPTPKYTVAEVYELILKDLDDAIALNALLDEGVNQQRVGKSFAYAVQARVFLSMRRYNDALIAARNSLAINSIIDNHNNMLVDYPVTGVSPNPKGWARPTFSSKEDLFNVPAVMYLNWFAPELLAVFDPNSVLFNYMPTQVNIPFAGDFGGSYHGMPGEKAVWTLGGTMSEVSGIGLTTVDMHLIEAECLMHTNNLSAAKEKLELIRRYRIITDRYAPSPASSKAEIFALLKQLSRSENWNTMKDFIDLKRWNTESEFAANLYRTMLGVTYTLTPQSKMWIWPFPQSATNFNHDLTQNY